MSESRIREVLERLSAAIVLSDPSDLSSLAEIQGDLGQIVSCAHDDAKQLLAAGAEADARILEEALKSMVADIEQSLGTGEQLSSHAGLPELQRRLSAVVLGSEEAATASAAELVELAAVSVEHEDASPPAETTTDWRRASGAVLVRETIKVNADRLNELVEAIGELGKGRILSLRLHLILAIIEGMVIRVGEQRYVIPTLSIVRMIQPLGGALSGTLGLSNAAILPDGRAALILDIAGLVQLATKTAATTATLAAVC